MNVNEFDYQRDMVDLMRAGWRVATFVRGDATFGEEKLARLESNINKHRLVDPRESHKRGDARRRFEDRAITILSGG